MCLPLIASRLIKGMVQLALFLVTEDSDLRGPPQCNVEKVESGAKEETLHRTVMVSYS